MTELNDAILSELGSSWQDWRPLDLHGLSAVGAVGLSEKASRLIDAECRDVALSVLDDPRIGRLAPFWLNLLADKDIAPSAIIVVRHPLDVAQALRSQDGLSLNQGLLLWLRYVLDAEANSRGVPRSIVVWTRFVANPDAEVRRIASDLEMEWPTGIATAQSTFDALLANEPDRDGVGADETVVGHPEIRGWAVTVYEAMVRLSEEPMANSAWVDLDRVRKQFESASGLLDALSAGRGAEPRADVLPKAPERQVASADTFAGSAEEAIARAAEAIAQIEAERAELRLDRARLEDLVLAAKVEREAGSRLLAAKEGELGTLREALATASGELTQMVGGVSALTGIIGRQDEEISRLNAKFIAASEAAAQATETLQASMCAAEAEAERLGTELAFERNSARAAAAQHAQEIGEAEARLTASKEAAVREAEMMQAGIRAAEAEAERLATELASEQARARTAAGEYVRDVEEAQARLAEANDAAARGAETLQASVREAEAEVKRLAAELVSERAGARTAADQHATEVKEAEARLATARVAAARQTEALEASVRAAEAEAKRLASELASEQATARTIAAQHADEFKEAAERLSDLKAAADRETETLRTQTRTAQAEAKRLATELSFEQANARTAIAQQAQEILKAEARFADATALLDEREAVAARTVVEMGLLRRRAVDLEGQLAEVAARLAASQAEAAPKPLRGFMKWWRRGTS